MMYRALKNKIILLTGATSMIGTATAKLLSSKDVTLLLLGRSESKLKALSGNLTNESKYFTVDANDEKALNEILEEIIQHYPNIYGLIHNTGIYPYNPVESLSSEDWRATLNINLTAPFLISKKVIPSMKHHGGGRILFITSIAGNTVGLPNMSAYAATKAGLTGFMKSLAIELASSNITVNTISPGKMYNESQLSSEEIHMLLKSIPLKRFIKPIEIAQMIEFLLSNATVNVTGQNFIMDGGQSILAEEAHLTR